MTLQGMLDEKRLAVFLGAGGVGKTTIAAACAMQAARRREALVLTIDPAKRLADALGVRVGSRETAVQGRLSAAMLDTKQALDEMVGKYAPSPERLRRILASPFYQQLSDAFAGSEEFVASGKVYEILQEGRFEIIVVDTPPSKHAMDFLEVPDRLVRVYESGAVTWLVKPTRFLRLAGGRATSLLGRWTSQQYLEDVAAFFMEFDRMFLEMEQRVRAMRRVLTDKGQTGIALVAGPEPASLAMAERFHDELTRRLGLTVDAVVVNRVLPHPPRDPGLPQPEFQARLAGALVAGLALPADQAEILANGVVGGSGLYRELAEVQREGVQRLAERLPCEVLQVPALPESVASLQGLERIRFSLFGQ